MNTHLRLIITATYLISCTSLFAMWKVHEGNYKKWTFKRTKFYRESIDALNFIEHFETAFKRYDPASAPNFEAFTRRKAQAIDEALNRGHCPNLLKKLIIDHEQFDYVLPKTSIDQLFDQARQKVREEDAKRMARSSSDRFESHPDLTQAQRRLEEFRDQHRAELLKLEEEQLYQSNYFEKFISFFKRKFTKHPIKYTAYILATTTLIAISTVVLIKLLRKNEQKDK